MASANVVPLAFEENLVRVIKPNGEPWFVGKDVCQVLEIRDHHQALERLDEDERGGYTVPTPQGEQTVICVSEPGVYRLIFSSRKPQAERFKRWLAHEVLPALRKTGFYGAARADADPLAEFPTEDRALSEHLAKIATLRECRLIHGPRAAARLWRRLGMPAVQESAVYESDAGRACLACLLDYVVVEDAQFGDHKRLRWLIDMALDNDDLDAERVLRDDYGIRALAERNGFVVANNGTKLWQVFKGTPWAEGRWRHALRKLPGAVASERMMLAGAQRRGTFVPATYLDDAPPAPVVGDNVVPLHGA